ncbi:hypothetical protein [Amycolatopsis kentuckyensis]|uniref:hypothetical protein n=1 Tax=Amycolatopsis kentuckyensis TaxID=218823 RepID=UPI000A35E9FC|nr:hypothetical protein [Amycolatopsis kentuckyensis]
MTEDPRIERAHAALGGPALTTDAELRALTPDQLEKCIHRALEARDVQAVEGYLLLMALKDPRRAQDLIDTLKVGLRLAEEQPGEVASSTPRPSETPTASEGWSEYAYMNSEEHP